MLQGTAVCAFGDETRWEKSKALQGLQIAGIGKYSFIGITGDNRAFDFGQVFIGKSAEQKFTLENFSNVHANFVIRKAEKNANPYFEFSHSSGTVAPQCKLEITVCISPLLSPLKLTSINSDYL